MTPTKMQGDNIVDEGDLTNSPRKTFCSECIETLHRGCLPPDHCEQDKEPLDLKDRFIGPVDVRIGIIQRHAHELYDLLRTLPGRSGDGRDDRSPVPGQAHDKYERWNEDLAVIIRKRLDSALVKTLLRTQGGSLEAYPADQDGLRVISIGAINITIRLRSLSVRP
ncbi:hypothetical protein MY11210_001089 [Beauveria gryllotalpidicola]